MTAFSLSVTWHMAQLSRQLALPNPVRHPGPGQAQRLCRSIHPMKFEEVEQRALRRRTAAAADSGRRPGLQDLVLQIPLSISDGKVILKELQASQQQELMRDLQQKAREAWWAPTTLGGCSTFTTRKTLRRTHSSLSALHPSKPSQDRALELGGGDVGPPRLASLKGTAASRSLGSMNGSPGWGGVLLPIPSVGTGPKKLSISESLADCGALQRHGNGPGQEAPSGRRLRQEV